MSKRATPLKKPEIVLDQNASAPLYRQLYERLRGAILAGHLETGARLPSTRVLASELGVSRTTTALAYELLLLEGYIESRVGDGTRVTRLLPEQLCQGSRNAQDQDTTDTSGTPPAVLSRRGHVLVNMPYPEAFYTYQARAGKSLFLVGQPNVTAFPYETWARLVARHARQSLQAVSLYQNVQGYAPLREAIATHIGLTRGVHCSPEQIILTAGTQGALDLVAPPELLTGLSKARRLIDMHLPLLEQMALADFLAEGHFARYLRKMRLLYAERRNALIEALRRELGDLLDVTVPEAGLHLAAWLPAGMSAHIATQQAAAHGLHLLPISHFSLRPLQRDGMLLGFASASPEELRAGVQTLALALRAQ